MTNQATTPRIAPELNNGSMTREKLVGDAGSYEG